MSPLMPILRIYSKNSSESIEVKNAYIKGITKTSKLPQSLSTSKMIGSGYQSTGVYSLKNNQNLVVKKGFDHLLFTNEEKIGKIIGDHPNFMKVIDLFSKVYIGKSVKYKLVSEKIEGDWLLHPKSAERLDITSVKIIIKSAFEAFQYLDSKKVLWNDIGNPGNILITSDNQIVFLDFADYQLEEDDKKRRANSLDQLWDFMLILECNVSRGKLKKPECVELLKSAASLINNSMREENPDITALEKKISLLT